jgi:hypothetical protein
MKVKPGSGSVNSLHWLYTNRRLLHGTDLGSTYLLTPETNDPARVDFVQYSNKFVSDPSLFFCFS